MLHEHFHFIEGLEISSLKEALSTHEAASYIGKFDLASFPLAALNTALLEEGLFIRISKPLDKPLALIYHNKEEKMANIRNLIVLEKGAKAEIIEVFEGADSPYLTNIVTDRLPRKPPFYTTNFKTKAKMPFILPFQMFWLKAKESIKVIYSPKALNFQGAKTTFCSKKKTPKLL